MVIRLQRTVVFSRIEQNYLLVYLLYIFQVAYNAEGKPQTTLDIRSSSKTARISSLLPGRTYTVNVTASSNGRRGQGVTIVQTTGEKFRSCCGRIKYSDMLTIT